MTATAVRMSEGKIKPRQRAKRGGKNKLAALPTIQIQVQDLRVGDRIATALTENTALAIATKDVKELAVCEGQWRTHVHVNGTECYDGRSFIRIVF